MVSTPLDTVATMLESLLDVVEDEQARFKLRTALQLVDVAQDERDRATDTLGAADLDPELEDRLRKLGYLD